MKDNKTIYIDFILNELNNGNVQFKEVLPIFVGKWGVSEKTFERYWKIANEKHKIERDAIKEAKLSETIQIEKQAVKKLLLDKYERMRIAEDIALGLAQESNGKIITPSPADKLKALDYLAKIEGDYATSKLEMSFNVGLDMEEEFE